MVSKADSEASRTALENEANPAFTFGPWEAQARTRGERGIAIIAVHPDVPPGGTPTRGMVAWIGDSGANCRNPATQRANARLIAATPHLYVALADLVAILDKAGLLNLSNGVQLGATSWYVKASERLKRARQALARAVSPEVREAQPLGSDSLVSEGKAESADATDDVATLTARLATLEAENAKLIERNARSRHLYTLAFDNQVRFAELHAAAEKQLEAANARISDLTAEQADKDEQIRKLLECTSLFCPYEKRMLAAERRVRVLEAEQAQQKEHVHDYSDYQICRVCGRTEAAIDGQCHHCTDDDSIKNGRCWWCLRPLAATDAADAPIRESERVPHDQ